VYARSVSTDRKPTDPKAIVLSRRAKFVAAALAATGIAIVHEHVSHALDDVPRGASPAASSTGDGGTAAKRPSEASDAGSRARDAGPRAPLTKAERAQRDEWLARAKEAHAEGDFATAIAATRRAYTLDPDAKVARGAVGIVLSLAESLEKEGKLVAALEALEYELGQGVLVDLQDPKVVALADALRVRCPTVVLEIPKDARVTIDGVPRIVDGKPLRIDPGEHVFKVETREDQRSVEERVIVREAEKLRVIHIEPRGPEVCLTPRVCLEPPFDDRPRPRSCGCEIPGKG
jgi:hypothetical protein